MTAGDLDRVGQVRRADVDRRLAGVAVEEPCLSLQSGSGRVVADLEHRLQQLGFKLSDLTCTGQPEFVLHRLPALQFVGVFESIVK